MLKFFLLISLLSLSSCFATKICGSIDYNNYERIVWTGGYVYDIIPRPGFRIVSLIYTIKSINNSPFTYYTSLIGNSEQHIINNLSNTYIRTDRVSVLNNTEGLILTIQCENILFSCEAEMDITVEELPGEINYLMLGISVVYIVMLIGAFSFAMMYS